MKKQSGNNVKGELKAVQATTEDGKKVSKAVIKGGRLKYYPNYTKLYRTSRGIKRPVAYHMTEKEAQEIIGDAPLTFEKTIEITDGDQHINTINYRHYNLLNKGKGKKYGKEQET